MIAPGKIAPGQPVRLTSAYQDSVTGNPVDPSTVQFLIETPCGRMTTYTYATDAELVKASVGNYYIDVTPTEGGRWHFRWVSTGTGAGATEGDFVVQTSRFVHPDYCDYWPDYL